ncbi:MULTISPECIES: GNAT family N-acetyltransferase [Vagococcus]|uniref:Acetyltransferase n=1 Tax=Vagococcus fluvialis bH819 TaxID=1255619 RepID=A0A1X6WNE2_9ENTE|nr:MULTISPECIES: GNAT family N-acetyltransferase [Vagococcus]SLM85843.1 Acetyltransferase [Vagococcus fluvialis bH819]HCM90265.1 GNAT family N-acetyltransferase [Vagococcus sp.]
MVENISLIKPSMDFEKGILAYQVEFSEFVHGSSLLAEFETINGWLEYLKLSENKETIPNKNFVPCIEYMLVNNDSKKVLGLLNLRLELNDYLTKIGGYIGYSVAPSERRKGYGSLMLKEGLKLAKTYHIDPVLLTCDDDNLGSASVIENNGGVLENKVYIEEDKVWVRRYWIENN